MKLDIEKNKKIIFFIIVLAIIIRIIFAFSTKINTFQFDFGTSDVIEAEDYDKLYTNYNQGLHKARHINYIMRLYHNEGFSDEIKGQFYHPPLHYLIMSNWLKLMDIVSNNSIIKLESMKFVTIIYSFVFLITFYKILNELEIENKLVPMMLISFYPLFIYMSGLLNNDMLVAMFSMISILYLIKWEKNPSIKNTIILANAIGFGLMTKTAIFVMFIPAVIIYFKKLIETNKKGESVKKLIIELIIFSAICFPLGLWFHFYYLLKGEITIGIAEPFEYFSLKDYSLIQRFGFTSLAKMNFYNLWNYLLFSSYNFDIINTDGFFQTLLIVITIMYFIMGLYYLFKVGKKIILLHLHLLHGG